MVGISSEFKHETLENSVVGIFDTLGCGIDADQIKSCHHLSKTNMKVVVKCTRCKVSTKVQIKKSRVKSFRLPGHEKIFINSS